MDPIRANLRFPDLVKNVGLSAVFATRCGFPVRPDHEILSVVA